VRKVRAGTWVYRLSRIIKTCGQLKKFARGKRKKKRKRKRRLFTRQAQNTSKAAANTEGKPEGKGKKGQENRKQHGSMMTRDKSLPSNQGGGGQSAPFFVWGDYLAKKSSGSR